MDYLTNVYKEGYNGYDMENVFHIKKKFKKKEKTKMKKIKGLLFAFVALFAFTLAMVTANADVDFGLYSVNTTANANDTAIWDYSSVNAATFINEDILSGGVIVSNEGNTNTSTKWVKGGKDEAKGGFLDVYSGAAADGLGGTIYVPVPSETAAGTFTMWTLDTKDGGTDWRALLVNGDKENKISSKNLAAGGDSYTFTADDLTDFEGKFYLKLVGWSNAASKEVKITKMQIVLTSGAYAAAAANYDVKIYDGETALFDNKMTEGTTITYKPIKWGYDFVGFYSDAELTQSYNVATPISGNTTLYVKWNAWPAGTIASSKRLDLNLMAKGYDTVGNVNPGQVLSLGETYSLLAGNTVFEADGGEKTIDDLGKATHHIKTGGAIKAENNTNGLLLNATGAGQLVVYAKSGSSSSARTIDAIPTTGSTIHSETVSDTIIKVTLDIPAAGTYKIGSEAGSVLIYYVDFVQSSVELYQERVAADDVEHVRLVAVVENIEDLSDLSFVLKSSAFENDLVLTAAAKVAKRITDHGETYSLGGVTFDVKDGVVYIKCVVEVGAKYAEASFTAEITVGGITKTVTVNALA